MAGLVKLLIAVLCGICFAGSAYADLAKQINNIISRPSQKKVEFAIDIVKADSGKPVYSHNANAAMIPASNMKVIVTAAALKCLGPNFEYITRVGLCGNTLAVKGSGDPLLGDPVIDAKYGRKAGWIFEDIATKLKQNGITAIGDIVVDGSIFDNERVNPNWPKDQLNQWYACEVSGLNYNDNCIAVTVKNINGKVTVAIEPQTNYIAILNEVVPTRNGKGAVGAYRNQEANKIVIKGKCEKEEGPFDVAIEKPAEFFGFLLRENLSGAGIKVDGPMFEKPLSPDCNFREIAEYRTPLTDCLARCNKNSLGLGAESLLKTIAAVSSPDKKNGSWPAGREILVKYLLGLGVDGNEFYIDDGSGLSRQDKLSANAITRVFLDVYKGPNWEIYKNSLAVGGMEGTAGKYFKEAKYKGKIFGKTGYIGGVRAFSGVCNTARGDYIFSILTNNSNWESRGAINDIVKAIIDDN